MRISTGWAIASAAIAAMAVTLVLIVTAPASNAQKPAPVRKTTVPTVETTIPHHEACRLRLITERCDYF